MATITHETSTASTSNTGTYITPSFTPAAGDLIVLLVTTVSTLSVGAATSSQSGQTYVKVTEALRDGGVNKAYVYVAETLSTATSQTATFHCSSDVADGVSTQVVAIAGMTKNGLEAIRQYAIQENQAASTTPAPVFASACLTGNPVIGLISNSTSPAGMTPPSGFTEGLDTGFITPTTGAEYAYKESGFTGTTVTWGSTSASTYSAIVIELDTTTAGNEGTSDKTIATFTGTATGTAAGRVNLEAFVNSSTDGTVYTTGSFTPSAGSLLVVAITTTGTASVGSVTGTQAGQTFTNVNTAVRNASADRSYIFVSDALTTATSQTVSFNCSSDAATGAMVQVFSIADMSRVGIGAIKQSTLSQNQAASTTPSTIFSIAPLTSNIIIASISNATNPSGLTPPANFTEVINTGYSTPSTGIDTIYKESGYTATTITWGSTSATVWGGIAVEVDTSATGTTGTSSKTIATLGGTATGSFRATGTSDTDISDISGTSTGGVRATGTSSKTIASMSGSSTGVNGTGITGINSNKTINFTGTSTGTLRATGTSNKTIATFTGSASGINSAGRVGTSNKIIATFTGISFGEFDFQPSLRMYESPLRDKHVVSGVRNYSFESGERNSNFVSGERNSNFFSASKNATYLTPSRIGT